MTEETLEEMVFKTLSHQKRRDILRVVGEKKKATFTEIKNQVDLPDSASLSYHLNALDRLIVQDGGKYRLSELGRDAYSLICKTTTYTQTSSLISLLRKEITIVIVSNAVLWALAIVAVSQFEGRPNPSTLYSFAALWFVSNIILYSILKTARQSGRC